MFHEHGEAVIATTDEKNGQIDCTLECQPYRPLRSYQCLVKMALSIMPEIELSRFDVARRWVLEPMTRTSVPTSLWARCDWLFTPKPFSEPWVALYRRIDDRADVPYMLFLCRFRQLGFPDTGALFIKG